MKGALRQRWWVGAVAAAVVLAGAGATVVGAGGEDPEAAPVPSPGPQTAVESDVRDVPLPPSGSPDDEPRAPDRARERSGAAPAPPVPRGAPPGELDLDVRPLSGPAGRGVLAVKVSNTSRDRPQTGLLAADIVYEEIVEGGVTRFVALHHSRVPGVVGPIRSGRLVDADLLPPYGASLAMSGARDEVRDELGEAGVGFFTERSGAMYRDPGRRAPHDLFARGDALFGQVGGRDTPPATGWRFAQDPPRGTCDPSRGSGDGSSGSGDGSGGDGGGSDDGAGGDGDDDDGSGDDGAGDDGAGDDGGQEEPGELLPGELSGAGAATGPGHRGGGRSSATAGSASAADRRCRATTELSVRMSSHAVTGWRWDPQAGGYRRFQNGRRHLVRGGTQVGAANVVVLGVEVREGACCDSAGNRLVESQVVGSGPAIVLRDARRYDVTWRKPARGRHLVVEDDAGRPLPLRAGPTWVLIAPRENLPE